MARPRVANVCPNEVPAAVAVQLPDGEWAAGGDPYWRNRTNIHARFSLLNNEPNLELTFSKSKSEEGYASTKFPLGLCASLEFQEGQFSPGKPHTSSILRFWEEETSVYIPDKNSGSLRILQYMTLSLTGVPKLNWEKNNLDGGMASGNGVVWETLGPGGGKTEILIVFSPDDQYAQMDWEVLRVFEERCKAIGELKKTCAALKGKGNGKEKEVEVQGPGPRRRSGGESTATVEAPIAPPPVPQRSIPQAHASTLGSSGTATKQPARLPRAGGWAGDGRGVRRPPQVESPPPKRRKITPSVPAPPPPPDQAETPPTAPPEQDKEPNSAEERQKAVIIKGMRDMIADVEKSHDVNVAERLFEAMKKTMLELSHTPRH